MKQTMRTLWDKVRLAQDGAHVLVADICGLLTDLPCAGSGRWEELFAVAREIEGFGVRAVAMRVDVTDDEASFITGQAYDQNGGRN